MGFNAAILRRRRRAGGAVSSLALQLFPNGEVGAMYDPSQLDTMYQAVNAELSAVAADGDPVGVLLDIRLWNGKTFDQVMAAQDNLVPNGDFSTPGLSDYTLTLNGQTIENTAGYMRIVSDGTFCSASISSLITPGKLYYLSADVTVVSGSGVRLILGGVTITVSATKTVTALVVAGNADWAIWRNGATESQIDNIVIKEIPGNHATQATAASRPTYKTALGLHWLKGDGVADTAKTTAFAADGDILITAAVNEQTSGTLVELRNNSSTSERIAITENQVEVRGDNGQADQTIALTLSGDHVVSVVATESDRKVEAFVDGVSAGSVTLAGTAWFDTTSTNKTVSILATNGGADFSDGHIYWLVVRVSANAVSVRSIAETAAGERIGA